MLSSLSLISHMRLAPIALLAIAILSPAAARPNFVVILVDDAALMDFGAYGGEAATPNIDALAERGVMLSRFHTSPLCAPSRAMLLTGIDNHRTGIATIPEILPASQRGKPGYSMSIEPGVSTIAARLKSVGYRTYMTGKWHLGHANGALPVHHGFDRSFVLDASGADNWEQKPYIPYYATAPWFEDHLPAKLPEDFYSSDFIVGKMLEYLDNDLDDVRPFFSFVSFQAIHIPVQAPAELTAKYIATYADGWDKMREKRWRRAQEIGLIPEGAALGPMAPGLRKWNTLNTDEKALAAKSMAANAAMLESMDKHIGRLIARLEENGALADTVFIITSDNGPEPSDPLSIRGYGLWMRLNGYSRSLTDLGERGSMNYIGPEWASAAASPSALFKFYATEGGTRAPLIFSGPGVDLGGRSNAFSYVTDIAPTILELAGVDPSADDGELASLAFTGRSLVPLLTGAREEIYDAQTPVGLEVSGNAALYKGDFKLVRALPRYGDGSWRLFNLATDPGETSDLSTVLPEKFVELLRDYEHYAAEMGVLDLPPGYSTVRQLSKNALVAMLKHHSLAIFSAGLALGVIVLLIGYAAAKRSRRRQ